jgi:TetR/AcrR family transcriptional regulator, mexJK operon transcriptional repressor
MTVHRAYPRSGRERPVKSGVPRMTSRGGRVGASERKRAAIVDAALRLFMQDGYARTSVDAIADEAQVSKRTIYNHYGDKKNLFLSVVGEKFDSMMAVFVEMMDVYLSDVPDDAVEANIVAFACEATALAARSQERLALLRLVSAEAPHFPELRARRMRPQTVAGEIATRLVRLAARGLLEVPEPEEAANHLFALTIGQMNNRSLLRSVELTDSEIEHIATSGARAFLRAYLPR